MTTDVTWRRLRKFVKNRDKGICQYCGIFADDGHCDHKIPISKGGTDNINNLAWSCAKCNLKKKDKLPQEFKEETSKVQKERLSLIKELQETIIRYLIPSYSELPDLSLYSNDEAKEIKKKWLHEFEKMKGQKIRNWLRFRIYPDETILASIDYHFLIEKDIVEYVGLATTWEHENDKELLQQLVDCGQIVYEELIDPASKVSLGMFYHRAYNMWEEFGYDSYNKIPHSYIPGRFLQPKQRII